MTNKSLCISHMTAGDNLFHLLNGQSATLEEQRDLVDDLLQKNWAGQLQQVTGQFLSSSHSNLTAMKPSVNLGKTGILDVHRILTHLGGTKYFARTKQIVTLENNVMYSLELTMEPKCSTDLNLQSSSKRHSFTHRYTMGKAVVLRSVYLIPLCIEGCPRTSVSMIC